MSTRQVIPNSWTVFDADDAVVLTYAPQVYPSPLRVSLLGSLQVVITNQTRADVLVEGITFAIPVGAAQDTLTAGTIQAQVTDSAWSVVPLNDELNTKTARFILGPAANDSVKLAAGAAVIVQFYGFPTHDQPGTATIAITERTQKPTAAIGRASFTVTTFPWGFTFSDLAANVRVGLALNPVAQVDHGSSVTLTWNCSVAELTAYEIYCSTSEGQSRAYTPTLNGQWESPKLTTDTVFIVVVKPTGLIAALSTAVAVTHPDVHVGSLVVGDKTLVASDGSVGITANTLGFTAGAHRLVIDHTSGIGAAGGLNVAGGMGVTGDVKITGDVKVTGGLDVTNGVSVTGGIQLDGANAAIQRGDVKLTTGDLGLYSNNPSAWIRLVTNNAPIKLFTDGAGGTNVAVSVDPDASLHAHGPAGINVDSPTGGLRLSTATYTGFAGGNNNSEISNDLTQTFGALMLVGNTARKAGGPRWLQAWDNLEVRGDLFVFGSAQFKPFGETGWCTLAYYNIHRNGTYWEGTSGPPTPSDLRLKCDVQPVPSALDKIGCLSGVTFRWNETAVEHFTSDIETSMSAGPDATERENREVWQAERDKRRQALAANRLGVVAQEVEAVLPEAVTTDATGYKSVRYDDLIPVLIEAIKEQAEIVARQQRDIERLKLAMGIE